ncbi:MAG: YggU family protein [Desulfomonile tiedjei]|nr:YggU family protein [Desulfomonile tiedjei]
MYLRDHSEGVTIEARIAPNASRNAIMLDSAGRLIIRLTAPPTEGKANKSLVKFLAKRLGVAPSSITIVRGHASRDKVLLVSGLDELTARRRLEAGT